MNRITITATYRLAALLLAALLTLSACGTAANATDGKYANAAPATNIGTNGTLDACALLTQEEATTALGQAVKPAEHGAVEHVGDATSASVSTCNYNAVDADSLASIGLLVRRAPSDENTPSAIDAVRATVKELGTDDPQDVAGVGDSAFWGAHQLHVFAGGRSYIIVSMFGMPDDDAAREKAQQLAELVLGRL